ncbi:hypothetical protein BGZ95_010806, partial [Linnemannia exigua]
MLQQLTPRLSAQARLFLRTASVASASPFPRRPVFFSSTARSCYSTASTTPPSDLAPGTDASGANTAQPVSEEPTPTNLTNPPDSVSCTVSPPPTYAFLKPTPVVLLTGPFGGNWCFRETWQESLADQGYQSTSIELSMPHQPLDSGDAYIRHFVKTLKTAIETDHSFYPPILIAHGLHALVAQKYVESNPVSALVLVSPFIPDVIQRRFQELSHKLKLKDSTATTATAAAASMTKDNKEEVVQGDSGSKAESTDDATSTSASASTSSSSSATLTDLPDFIFETHADVLAQDGFRERFVLPKKAVYKIDQVAKEHQEKEEAESKKKKQQQEQEESNASSAVDDSSAQGSSVGGTAAAEVEAKPSVSNPAKEVAELTETLGRDSVPIWESKEGKQDLLEEASSSSSTITTAIEAQDEVPVQTVESEASIPSALEQLPL